MKFLMMLAITAAAGVLLPAKVHSAEDGADLAWKYHCITCHGERGKSRDPRYPHIGGQTANYIETRLKYFRSRTEPANQMNAQAVPLSDEEITTLAQYLAAAAALLAALAAAPLMADELDGKALAQEKGCVACHALDGKATAPIYPHLKGQWERYLRLQLLAYQSGKRENAIMAGMVASLSKAEIRALAEYYAAQ